MPQVMVTRRVHFNAAHRLHNPVLSDEENERIFGRCNNPSFHGHNYELDVSVEGEIDPTTGYVVDLGIVKQIVEAEIVDHLDHKNLNPEFRHLTPTTENLAVVIWRLLEGHVPGRLKRVVLWETPRNYVVYTGG